MSLLVKNALDDFVKAFVQAHQQAGHNLVVEYDPQWPSPCYQEQGALGDWVDWLPVEQHKVHDFSELESALDITLDEQLKGYFSSYWSDNLNASTPRGKLQLLLPWNEDDFVRLQQNLVGHVLMKRRLGQTETFFFAVTDEEDFNLCIDSVTGEVVLERVGLAPQDVLAPDLATFIQSLSPELK